MATPTYELIQTQTVSGFATNITFSSIPNTYKDLIIVGEGQCSTTTAVYMRFNGDTGSNYSMTNASALGNNKYAAFYSDAFIRVTPRADWESTVRAMFIVQINDYSATDKHSVILGRAMKRTSTDLFTGRWANTTAINSILIDQEVSATFENGSTFSLFGIGA